MTIHHCPKCELRFERKTEMDDHIWHDHAEFRHDYPATAPPPPPPVVAPTPPRPESPAERRKRASLVGWLTPKESQEHPHEHHPVAEASAVARTEPEQREA